MKTKFLKAAALLLSFMMLLPMLAGCNLFGESGDKGETGSNGKSAYEIAVDNGFKGSETEWLATLIATKGFRGEQGQQGESGAAGQAGVDVKDAYVNDDFHLILVLADETEIDAGYVGQVLSYTVVFDLNYAGAENKPAAQTVNTGTCATMPDAQYRTDYLFTGWYTDPDCTVAYDFDLPVLSNMTLYAGWDAQDYDSLVLRMTEELDAMKALNGGRLPEIALDTGSYQPSFIIGSYSDQRVDSFESAVQSLGSIQNLMGFENAGEEYSNAGKTEFEGTTQYRMQQTHDGYEVYGQQLVVTTDENGATTSLSGGYTSVGALFDSTVNLTRDEAAAIVEDAGLEAPAADDGELVVYTLNGYNEMAYVFDGGIYTVVVSAIDGTVISATANALGAMPGEAEGEFEHTIGRNDENSTDNTFNTVWFDYSDASKTDTYIFYDSERNIAYFDLAGDTSVMDAGGNPIRDAYLGKAPLTDDNNIWLSDGSAKAIDLYKNLSKIYDFYHETLGLVSYDGNGGTVYAYVNDAYSAGQNAFNWGPVNGTTILSFGGVANYHEALDVVGHEYTHAMQSSITPGMSYANLEAGALMEAYSDVMGELLQLYYNGSTDWIHGNRNVQSPASGRDLVAVMRNGAFDVVEQQTPKKKDGVGYYYVRPTANTTPAMLASMNSSFAHHNSTVVSHAVYQMYQNGINDIEELTTLLYRAWNYLTTDATFYDYRMALLAAARDMGLEDAKLEAIKAAFNNAGITVESLSDDYSQTLWRNIEVPTTVVDAETGRRIEGARIQVKLFGRFEVADVYCDENGYENVLMPTGVLLEVTVTAPLGYGEYKGYYTFARNNSYELTIELEREGVDGAELIRAVGGSITSAMDNRAVAGVTMSFREGYNVTTGRPVLTLTTDEYGQYSYSESCNSDTAILKSMDYTVELSKDGYITSYVIVKAGVINWDGNADDSNLTRQNFAISPVAEVDGALRIVLKWGSSPSDLDSHLRGTTPGGYNYHVYYSQKTTYEGGVRIANLDLDDTSSFGPETTTVNTDGQSAMIGFYVHDYSNRDYSSSTAMAHSGATVQVYSGNALLATYEVSTSSSGNVWHVFDYDPTTGLIYAVNAYSAESSPSYVGAR